MYLGQFSTTGKTFDFGFTTVNSSGAPAAFSSGGITVYRDNSTVANTTGITLTSTFAGVTGLNRVRIAMAVTSTFYDAGGEYMAVIASGAASENLAGYTLAHWSVRRNTPVVVSTAVSISTASVISTAQTIASAGSITSTVAADVRLWIGTAPGTLGPNNNVQVSTAQTLFAVSTAGSVGSVTGNVTGSVGSVASATGIATAVWGATRASYTAAGSFGESISTGSSIASVSSAQTVTSVTSVNSTVQADVALWRGTAPSTLGVNSNVTISTASLISTAQAVAAVGSTVQADVALWRGTAPSTLGTGAFLVPSSTAAILSVLSVGSTVQADVGLWRGAAPSTLGPNSNLQVSTGTLISTAQTIASAGAITDALAEPATGPPQAAPTPAQAWSWQHYTLRHQIRVNSSNKTFFDSSGNTLWTKGLLGDSATYIELIGSTST